MGESYDKQYWFDRNCLLLEGKYTLNRLKKDGKEKETFHITVVCCSLVEGGFTASNESLCPLSKEASLSNFKHLVVLLLSRCW